MLNAAYRALGYQKVTGLAAAQSLTVPAGCTLILVTAETQAVRWRDDGVNPTATDGYPLPTATELQYASAQMGQLKFIEAAVSATLHVMYYGN